MKKNMTRKDLEQMLSCGEDYRPQEIKDGSFYFFKGYFIKLNDVGGYTISKRMWYNSATGATKEDTLKMAMDEVVKRELEAFDKQENMENVLKNRITAQILPLMERKMQEVIDELKD